jgi:hydrogenase small subunit
MDEPPGATFSSTLVMQYGKLIRSLRAITNASVNKEPKWRHPKPVLTTGYQPKYYGDGNGHDPTHGSGGDIRQPQHTQSHVE